MRKWMIFWGNMHNKYFKLFELTVRTCEWVQPSMACMNWAKVWGPAKSKSVVEADDELEDGSGGWFCAILKYSCLT